MQDSQKGVKTSRKQEYDIASALIFFRNKRLVSHGRPDIRNIMLEWRKPEWFGGQIFIGYKREKMINTIEPCPSFIICMNNMPG
jgi:hypothetical protein